MGAPAWSLFGMEPIRAALEYARMHMMDTTALPPGDGHPVVVFPGLAADRRSIAPLVSFCDRLGYTAYDWGRGINTGPQGDVDAWIDDLARHVDRLVSAHSERVSLVGWSLGGLYAREVAKVLGRRVRQVVTIGTPFTGTVEQNNASWLYRLVNGRALLDEKLMARLGTAPDVPTTSIFSRSDGVVAWQACIQDDVGANTENIEVEGSHFGLGWNPEVLAVLAGRLSQVPGRWQRHAAREA
jgi:alpha-beta hydrolase superfamily lysophospholipase